MSLYITCCCGKSYPVTPERVPASVECDCGAVWNMARSARIGQHVGLAYVLVREPKIELETEIQT